MQRYRFDITFFDLIGNINKEFPDKIAARFRTFIKMRLALCTLAGVAAVVGHDIEIGHIRIAGP